MVPPGLDAEQFRRRYRQCLDRVSDRLIERLGGLIRHADPAATGFHVEIVLDDEGASPPEAHGYFDGLPPGAGGHVEIGLELAPVIRFSPAYYDDPGFDALGLSADTVKTWFAECWWKAGGWFYPLPAWVDVHDGHGDGCAIGLSRHF